MAQLVKNPPAMQETWVQSLGWEDALEKGTATHSSILAGRIPMDRGAWRATVHGVEKSQTRLSTGHSTVLLQLLRDFCLLLGVQLGPRPLHGAGVLIQRSWTHPRGGSWKWCRHGSHLPLPTPDCLVCWLFSSCPHTAQLLCSLLRSKHWPAHLGP